MAKSSVFFWLLAAFVLGIALRSFVPVPPVLLLASSVAGIATSLIGWLHKEKFGMRRANKLAVAGFCIIAAGFGVFRYDGYDAAAHQTQIQQFANGKTATLEGVIIEEPDARDTQERLTVQISAIDDHGIAAEQGGYVLVFTERYPGYAYGDLVRLQGRLELPAAFNDFDYPSYLAAHGIAVLMRRPLVELISHDHGSKVRALLIRFKKQFEEHIDHALPEPHAAFATGLLVGARSSIPADLLTDFNTTGTTHIIALSGFNITIIAESLARLFSLLALGPLISFWATLASIIFFVLMAGASPSIIRAAIMGILVVLSRREGRMYAAPNALLFAAAVMVFQNPMILRFDRGFQLSFLATVGLLYASPLIEPYCKKLPIFLGLRENLVSTLSAQLLVLPILLFNFGRLPLVSPLVNILILSFVPAAMFLIFLVGMLGFVSALASATVAAVAYLLLAYQLGVVQFFARIPMSAVDIGQISPVVLVILYAGIVWMILKKRTNFSHIKKTRVAESWS